MRSTSRCSFRPKYGSEPCVTLLIDAQGVVGCRSLSRYGAQSESTCTLTVASLSRPVRAA
jgi:hypothetical protein